MRRFCGLFSACVLQSKLWSYIIRDLMDTVKLHPPAGFSLRLRSPAEKPDAADIAVSAEEEDGGLSGSQHGQADGSSALQAALLEALDNPELAKPQSTDEASGAPRLLRPRIAR